MEDNQMIRQAAITQAVEITKAWGQGSHTNPLTPDDVLRRVYEVLLALHFDVTSGRAYPRYEGPQSRQL